MVRHGRLILVLPAVLVVATCGQNGNSRHFVFGLSVAMIVN